MTRPSTLPLAFLAAVLTLNGAALATAQTADTDAAATAGTGPAAITPVDHRPGREGRGGFGLSALFEDADGDGTVTADEIDLALSALVARADAGSDGSITLEEYRTIFLELTQDRMVDGFQALDADGDGQVTAEEFDTALAGMVAHADRNGDGAITAEDRRGGAERHQRGPRRAPGGRDRG